MGSDGKMLFPKFLWRIFTLFDLILEFCLGTYKSSSCVKTLNASSWMKLILFPSKSLQNKKNFKRNFIFKI